MLKYTAINVVSLQKNILQPKFNNNSKNSLKPHEMLSRQHISTIYMMRLHHLVNSIVLKHKYSSF